MARWPRGSRAGPQRDPFHLPLPWATPVHQGM